LRLHQLIERMEGSHRYRLTSLGLRAAMFYARSCGQASRFCTIPE